MKKELLKDKDESIESDETLELDDQELAEVKISDTTIEEADKQTAAAKREAKKIAKKLRTPAEKKHLARKKLIILAVIVASVILVLLAVPRTRWPILNFIGFRANLQLTVEEGASKRPIGNASVQLEDGAFGLTDTFGRTTFEQIKLGPHTATAKKPGYGDVTVKLSNGLGITKHVISMKVIGIKLDFDLKNWLTGSPVEGAEIKYEKSSAKSDQTGRASLVIPPTDKGRIDVQISAPNYITKTLKTELDAESREVALVSAQKNYFISKRDGKYDIFSSNLDGSDQRKIIEATGKEEESVLQFTINRNNKQAVLVATREGEVQNGKVIAGIYSIDLEKATLKKVDEGSDIQLLDWADNSLIYTKTEQTLNYDDPALSRIVNFNSTTARVSEISQSNYFAVAILAQGKVFYMPTDPYRSIENAVLTSQDIASGTKKTYLAGKQISYATRSSYNSLELQDNSGANFELQILAGTTKAIDRRPATALAFSLSPNGQIVAWSDRRDGQGALLIKNVKTVDEKIVARSGGLTNPVRFISDDLVVVRVATSQETADYVVSTSSGKIGKIVDVSNVGLIRQGYL